MSVLIHSIPKNSLILFDSTIRLFMVSFMGRKGFHTYFFYSVVIFLSACALRCKIMKTFFDFANRRLWPTTRRTAFCTRFRVKLMRIILEFIKTAYIHSFIHIFSHDRDAPVSSNVHELECSWRNNFFHLQFCVHTQWTGIK